MSVWKRIAKLVGLSRTEQPTQFATGKLVATVDASVSVGIVDSGGYSPSTMRQFEIIYRRDGTIFGIVNRFVRSIVGVPFSIRAPEQIQQELEEWINRPGIEFRDILRGVVQDILVFGNAWVELVFNKLGDDIVKLNRIDPKCMDYKRDGRGHPVLNELGEPTTVVYQPTGGQKVELPKEKVAHFTFTKGAGELLGISPLETLYSIVKYKMNIENGLAEGLYRQVYCPIVVKVGSEAFEPTPAVIDSVAKGLEEFHKKTLLVVPYHYSIERLEMGGVKPPEKVVDFLLYLDRIIREAYGTSVIEGRERVPEFERAVRNYQEILEWQIKKEIFMPLAKVRKWEVVPEIQFAEFAPETTLLEARGYSYLARANVVTPDTETENYWRKRLGIPIKRTESVISSAT